MEREENRKFEIKNIPFFELAEECLGILNPGNYKIETKVHRECNITERYNYENRIYKPEKLQDI